MVGSNFEIALGILRNKYEDKNLIVNSHIKNMLNVPVLTKSNAHNLREFVTQVRCNIGALENLIVKEKLTDLIFIQIERGNSEYPTQTEFINFLDKNCKILENLSNEERPPKTKGGHYQSHHAFLQTRDQTNYFKCFLCKNNTHKIYSCTKYLNLLPEERIKVVKNAKACNWHNILLHLSHHSTEQAISSYLTRARSPSQPSQNSRGEGYYQNSSSAMSQQNQRHLVNNPNTEDDNHQTPASLSVSSQLQVVLLGIAQGSLTTKKITEIKFYSRFNKSQAFKTTCVVLKRITCYQLQFPINPRSIPVPDTIQLADPTFYKPAETEILLGADVYFDLVTDSNIRLGAHLPVLQNTYLGYVTAGKFNCTNSANSNFSSFHNFNNNYQSNSGFTLLHSNNMDLTNLIQSFSEIEEVNPHSTPGKFLAPEDQRVEQLFETTTKILPNGRYQVNLPLKSNDEHQRLGDSFTQDMLPTSHSIQKLRAVFDGSMKSSTGVSLNELTLKGYTIQPDLFNILFKFKTFGYNIHWRNSPEEPLWCIELATVIYETNCSPFLSTRCLQDIALKNKDRYPFASNALLKHCNVDDILFGGNNLNTLLEAHTQITKCLDTAHVKLHKWSSNSPEFLKALPKENSNPDNVLIPESSSNKVLGLSWNQNEDKFHIIMPHIEFKETYTKEQVLSTIASIYAPFGVINPMVIPVKLIKQEIWKENSSWDSILSVDILSKWKTFLSTLSSLSSLSIPRYTFRNSQIQKVKIHVFSDA
ncbi:uncharacterized protein, partial [Euwallacea similis]|uniref:uncharacterized protein n=1 Tax=Euwallacea similis TaxID=1736056 RepID=UPI00344B64A3